MQTNAWNPSGTYPFNWFREYSLPIWEKLLLPHLGEVKTYLELGIAHGLSLRYVLENVLAERGEAVGVDPYFPARTFGDHPREAAERKRIMLDNLTLWSDSHRKASDACFSFNKGDKSCTVFCESSDSFLLGNVDISIDLAYVDANHNASEALMDLVLTWHALNVGGVMVIDDVDQRYRGNRPRAWHACRAFEDCYEGFYDVLFKHQRMFAYRKIERRRKGDPPVLVMGDAIPPRK